MKTTNQLSLYFIFCFVALMGFISCKKDKDEPAPKSAIYIEGKEYPTVKIASQTWTATNYEGPGGLRFEDTDPMNKFGKYFLYSEIKKIELPDGWRIPTKADYTQLLESQGAIFDGLKVTNPEIIKKLTSETYWKNIPGNNSSGFNAYPAGYTFANYIPIPGDLAEFWTSEGLSMSIQEGANLTSLRIGFYDNSNSNEFRFNLRFVKDN